MKIIVADKILKKLKLEQTSDNYQLLYKIEELILNDVDDGFVIKKAQERNLLEMPECDCGEKKTPSFSFNGVLDDFYCDNPECDED